MLDSMVKAMAARSTKGLDAEAKQLRSRFILRYAEVAAACAQMEWLSDPSRLARTYMTYVLHRERDSAWWHEFDGYVAQPWFIWSYARAHDLLEAADVPCTPAPRLPRVLCPEHEERSMHADIDIEHDISNGEEGVLQIAIGEQDPTTDPDAPWLPKETEDVQAIQAVLKTCGFRKKMGRFERKIGEMQSPILDRAVETACTLLDAGFRVSVWEPEIERRVLSCDYMPEHRYWIGETQRDSTLTLVYPRDATLHHYVLMAGGIWTGRRVEIDICRVNRIEELAQRYPFRATREARRRMDAWHEAMRGATIYRCQHGTQRHVNPRDGFQRLLEREIVLPEDLIERDG